MINVDGQPTYIMVLKDASGLVKLYAAVNVEQYNLVTTASTQAECIQKYRTLIGTGTGSEVSDEIVGDGEQSSGEETQTPMVATENKTITVAEVKYIDIDGNTYVYLIDTAQNLYRQRAADNEQLLFVKAGDQLNLSCSGKEIVSFEFLPQANQSQ